MVTTAPPHTMRLIAIASLCALIACETGDSVDDTPTAEVTRGPLRFEGTYYGELVAAKRVDLHVPSLVDTYQLTVDSVLPDGAEVKQGDVVLTFVRESIELDLRDDLERLEIARAERMKVAQQLDKERIDLALQVQREELALERAQLQVVEGVNLISKLELEKAQLDVDKARLELELAQKALRTFEQKRAAALKVEDIKVEAAERKVNNKQQGLEQVELRAPVDGVLYAPYTRINWQRTKVAPGVVARGGDKVLEIPDLSRYHAHLHLRQRDAALISEGDEATIAPLILPDQPISGKVIKKDAFATTRNERLGTETSAGNLKEVLITVELDEAPPQLRPGNSARVVLRSTLAEEATLLPIGAATRRDDNTWAVRMSDGTERPVTLGRTNLSHVEVLDGLKPGERVRSSAADAETNTPAP